MRKKDAKLIRNLRALACDPGATPAERVAAQEKIGIVERRVSRKRPRDKEKWEKEKPIREQRKREREEQKRIIIELMARGEFELPRPQTPEEWDALKIKATEARRAKRAANKAKRKAEQRALSSA